MKVTEANLGAWVLKCNPLLSDPAALFRDGPVEKWCVAANYRSHLMRADQPVLLWVTGSRPAVYQRGFWGLGQLTGRVFGAGKLYAPMCIELLDPLVPASTLTDLDGLTDIEVLRQPQMANPSFLTAEEFQRLQPLLPG